MTETRREDVVTGPAGRDVLKNVVPSWESSKTRVRSREEVSIEASRVVGKEKEMTYEVQNSVSESNQSPDHRIRGLVLTLFALLEMLCISV